MATTKTEPITTPAEESSTPVEVDGLTEKQLKALLGDLNPKRVASRTQSGSKLSYLEAWDVRATLIRVFGFGGWSADVIREDLLLDERDIPKSGGGKTNFRVTYKVTVRLTIPQTGATYTESAVSSQAGSVFGDVADFAIKTAASDALKRCAMNLGTQFGLSLYNRGALADIVKVVLAPGQTEKIDAFRARREAPADVTPDDATHGVGDVDDAPASIEGYEKQAIEAPKETWLEKAQKAKDVEALRNVWRDAKHEFGRTATAEQKDILNKITAIGETLLARSEGATVPSDPAVEAVAEAAQTVAQGFAGKMGEPS